MDLEIYTDASIKTYQSGRTFGCSGAICPTTGQSIYTINPDTTNNRSELIAIDIGIKLAYSIYTREPEKYENIYLYSDSQFGIFGLTKWIFGWSKNIKNGVMYGSNRQPVKNQDLFIGILSYLSINKFKVKFRHQSGHVNVTRPKMLYDANEVFNKSNGYYLKPEDIYKISYYNDFVDKSTRLKLENINPNNFPIINNGNKEMINICLPKDFKKYIM